MNIENPLETIPVGFAFLRNLSQRDCIRIPQFKKMVDLLLQQYPNPLEAGCYFTDLFFNHLDKLYEVIGMERILTEENPKFVLGSIYIIIHKMMTGRTIRDWDPNITTLIRWTSNTAPGLERTVTMLIDEWILKHQMNAGMKKVRNHIDAELPDQPMDFSFLLDRDPFFLRMLDHPDSVETFRRFTRQMEIIMYRYVPRQEYNEPSRFSSSAWFIPC